MRILYILVFFFSITNSLSAQIKDITADEAMRYLKKKKIILLDVRTEAEVKESHIPKSIHIDVLQEEDFLEQIKKLDKKSTYIIYCRSGKRSVTAAERMQQEGFISVLNMKGGILSWKGPLVKNKP